MADALSSRYELSHEALWTALADLLAHFERTVDRDAFVDGCIDRIVDLFGADRGLLLLADEDGSTRVVNARGEGRALTDAEREEVSRTVVREALERNECVVGGLGRTNDTSQSLTKLGIWAAMATPLQVHDGRSPLGVLYVDVRRQTKFVGASHQEFFRAAAALVSIVVAQHRLLRATRTKLASAQARHAERHYVPPLEELLRPPSMRPIREEIEASLHTDAPILITGESGTGKTLLARAVADAMGRKPVVRAVLGFSDDLNTITSELFGHERGAFSGAIGKRQGLVEYADGGVLILDEVLNLPIHAQQLLLDFTQFGTYRPLGYQRQEPKRADVRIVAATNGDLREAIAERRFREDLYYRLAAVPLRVPPLRERSAEVPELALAYLRRISGDPTWELSSSAQALLASPEVTWPGNVRQLERAVERARGHALRRDPEARTLEAEHFDLRSIGWEGDRPPARPVAPSAAASDGSLAETWASLVESRKQLDELEVETVRRAPIENDGVVARAARALGVARTTLSNRVRALGLEGTGRSGRD